MSLTDTIGSLAVATKGQYMTGVSVDIGTSFVKPAGRVGDELTVQAVVTGLGAFAYQSSHARMWFLTVAPDYLRFPAPVGKSLAYTRVDFFNAQGQLAAYGRESRLLSPVRPGEGRALTPLLSQITRSTSGSPWGTR